MKLQHTGVAILFGLGLVGSPLLVYAEEEGSSSGQHVQDHQSHHAKDSKVKPTGIAPAAQEGSGSTVDVNTAQQDGREKPAAAKEKVDEGSH